MMDYKPLATPMILNPKLHVDLDFDLVDDLVYKQRNGSLVYLVNTKLDICFAVNTLNQYMVITTIQGYSITIALKPMNNFFW